MTVSRFGIASRFDTSPWPDTTPTLYRPFLNNEFYEQAFLDHIRSLGLRGVYVDAGSCLGTHTVWFALYCESTYVHAFDPRERCAQWTQMNVDANDLRHKVTVHKLGLSDAKGEATSLLDGVQEVFPVARLDRVVRARPQRRGGDRRVVVIKADVEGMEEVVLRGAKRILKRHRPVVLPRPGRRRSVLRWQHCWPRTATGRRGGSSTARRRTSSCRHHPNGCCDGWRSGCRSRCAG